MIYNKRKCAIPTPVENITFVVAFLATTVHIHNLNQYYM